MYLQCSKYTFLSNFTQTIYRWIYCIKKNCVADTKWVFVEVHCITLTKTCLIMPGDEGNGKKKWNKNPKQNWKTLKTTKQGGLPASVRPPRTSVLTWRLAQDLHPEGNRCGVTKHRALATSPEASERCLHVGKQGHTPGAGAVVK